MLIKLIWDFTNSFRKSEKKKKEAVESLGKKSSSRKFGKLIWQGRWRWLNGREEN